MYEPTKKRWGYIIFGLSMYARRVMGETGAGSFEDSYSQWSCQNHSKQK